MITEVRLRTINAAGFSLALMLVVGCTTSVATTDSDPPVGKTTQAVQGTCSGGQAGADFTNKCALAGGNETRCDGSGTALCCRPCRSGENCTTACFDRTEDAELSPDKLRPSHVVYTFYGGTLTNRVKQ
jgi:hypothetical protein